MAKQKIIIQKKKKYPGFTFIELLVVIVIIIIVATLSIISITNVRMRSRDSNRVLNVNQIVSALEAYNADNRSYPTFISVSQPISSASRIYIDAVPANPSPQTDGGCANEEFVYHPTKEGYKLTFCLGADNGRFKKGYNVCVNGNCKPATCGVSPIIDRDGYSYNTILIGGQCWMAENLKTKTKPDGTCINGGTPPSCGTASSADNGKGRSCYDNIENNCAIYGALYTWDTAMNGSTIEGDQGICPDGWHVPSLMEQRELFYSFSVPQSSDHCTPVTPDNPRYGYNCSPAGAALKTGGSSGFNGELAGYRDEDGSTFLDFGEIAGFISSLKKVGYVTFQLFPDDSQFSQEIRIWVEGTTVATSLRCLKN
jgi:uncharacterized protein (TIGR02145 family)